MLRGFQRTLDVQQIETLHRAALRILERTGLQIQGRFLLDALADAGCRVDFDAHRAWFRPELVERQDRSCLHLTRDVFAHRAHVAVTMNVEKHGNPPGLTGGMVRLLTTPERPTNPRRASERR